MKKIIYILIFILPLLLFACSSNQDETNTETQSLEIIDTSNLIVNERESIDVYELIKEKKATLESSGSLETERISLSDNLLISANLTGYHEGNININRDENQTIFSRNDDQVTCKGRGLSDDFISLLPNSQIYFTSTYMSTYTRYPREWDKNQRKMLEFYRYNLFLFSNCEIKFFKFNDNIYDVSKFTTESYIKNKYKENKYKADKNFIGKTLILLGETTNIDYLTYKEKEFPTVIINEITNCYLSTEEESLSLVNNSNIMIAGIFKSYEQETENSQTSLINLEPCKVLEIQN